MRTLRHPGPPDAVRIDAIRAEPHELRFTLQAGQSLARALTSPLVAAGFQCASVTVRGAALNPFRYVMPNSSPDGTHVAWFSATQTPEGTSRIEQANATVGWTDGAPSIHCHAVWREPDGQRRGGHILPNETLLSEPAEAVAWGFRTVRIETKPDPETNFTLFKPHGEADPLGRALVLRVKPNEDILTALETTAHAHGITDGTVRGSLGSLVGAKFADGVAVPDHATEVLVREGFIRNGCAAIDMLVVDMQGRVREGWLTRGENPVCITFDLFLELN
jgi:predicted DNA-binding protein with PD1-like motif